MLPARVGPRRPLAVIGAIVWASSLGAGAAAGQQAGPSPTRSSSAGDAVTASPSYGVFYERHEPTFYTGFAPRTLDPQRIHLHIGRGNQLRATVVLSDEEVQVYARDLLARSRTVRSLIEAGELQLTQNSAFEALDATERSVALERLVAEEPGMSAQALRERNTALLERLNPGRVFRIRMPLDEMIRRWVASLSARDLERVGEDRQLEILNAMLPTRLFLDRGRLDARTSAELKALLLETSKASASAGASGVGAIRPAFVRLFERVTQGHYPLRGDALEFIEFTALYPVGSVNEFTGYKGRQIPLYPTPGRWRLTTHQRSGTADHIAPWASYSYSPWLPYMHVGSSLHNAFHTPYWPLRLASADFLPDALRTTTARSRDGSRFSSLYLLSRGPISHGCTHVNPGHLVELRQILPSETAQLDEVEVFINQSHLFDVFDIDGDLEPEVMGVRYFVAYSLRDTRPDRLRAPTDRTSFYDWLYAGELRQTPDGRGYFADVRDAAFAGDRATEGATYRRIPLYEAAYEPERVQFYATRPIPFVRELRKVGAAHPFSEERARTDQPL